MKNPATSQAFTALEDRIRTGNIFRGSIPLRLGLIASGLCVFQSGFSIWLQTPAFWHPATVAFNTATWILGISCMLSAMITDVPRRAHWLILAGLVATLWSSAYIARSNYSPLYTSHTDNEMIGEYAAEALRYGYNPYAWNFSDAARVYYDLGSRVTTFLDGSPQNRLTYPALPTLTLIMFGVIGLGQARTISLIFHTILLILVFIGTPIRLRPFLGLSFFAVREIAINTFSGLQDVVWSTLLVAMVLAWQRPWLRGILFGLACAYRQQPWILAPFLLIQLWYSTGDPAERRQRLLHFLTVSAGTFLVINLPFMLWDFPAWTRGVFEPVYAAFNVYSQGSGALTQYGLLPLPRAFYSGLQLSTLAIMLVLHWRHPRWVGQAFWIFPGIFFWLYYRGLSNYWFYWIPPMLVALASPIWLASSRVKNSPRRQWTAAVIVALIATSIAWGMFLIQSQPTIAASLWYPLESFDERSVSRLGLVVNNTTDRVLQPRFSIQHGGTQPLAWVVEDGPDILKPGESARYMIRTSNGSRAFAMARGAQVVVSDGGNGDELRAVVDVAPDRTFDSPDLILNPSFSFWSPYRRSPAGWTWSTSEAEAGRPRFELVEDQWAVLLSVERGTGRLSQTITFPGPFSIWVRRAAIAEEPAPEGYGLEFNDGEHRLWVLFSDREGREQVNSGFGIMYLNTPLNEWSRQRIDLAAFYALFDWQLPAYTTRSSQGLEFAARQVMLSLMVSGTRVTQAFGPIEQDPGFASPRARIDEAIAHPDDYYVNLGDEYCRQRNADLAREAYLRALTFNPENSLAQRGLETCQ